MPLIVPNAPLVLRLLAGIVLFVMAAQPAAAQPGTVSLSGRVTDAAGTGIPGVTLTVTGGPLPVLPVATDGSGAFAVAGLAPAVYTVTPSRAGFVHAPGSRTVTLLQGAAVLDFIEAALSHTISGQVVDATGAAVAGADVAIDGAAPATTTTDAAGRFAFFQVPPGGPVSVTPSSAGFIFAPASHAIASLDGDVQVPPFRAASGQFRRFLAEGVANGFFDTRIALLNPTAEPTGVRLTFQTSAGHTAVHEVAMAARSRVTIDPRTAGAGEADFSTVIESTQPLVVDRTVRWGPGGYGSHAESSVASPHTTWYFAEGATTGSFHLFYLLQNPGSQAAAVEIRYLRPAPLAPIVKTYAVAPASRRTIYVNQEDAALDEAEISAVITSQNGVPIIAERAMYANVAGQVFGAGHESAGLPAPSAQWFLAEGATGPFFNLFILVANPTSRPAPLEVRYLLTDGRVITRQHTAAANSRLTIGVHGEHADLANAAMSAIVTSTTGVPVLVERAMWWPANAPAWYEAHSSAGATATGTVWATADGEAGGPSGAETYLLIANTASYPGSARVTLVFEDGGTASRTVPLLPLSRRNVAAGGDFPEAVGRRFGAIVESLGALPAPIVVERAMYSNAGGVVWAAGSNLVATRLSGQPAVPVILAPSQPAGPAVLPVTVAGILGSDPESPASAAIPDVVAEDRTPPAEVSADAQGLRIVRTKIEIGFARTATVAQVNFVLDAIGGRIVNAIAGVTVVVVRIPDPGSLAGLEAVLERTRTLPSVTSATLILIPAEEALPSSHIPPTLGLATIDHLLAARAPAAWNVAAALDASSQPIVVIEDYFGNGPTNAAVDAGLLASDFFVGSPKEHGYHVLGTILGTFATVTTLTAAPNEVVGLFPRRADLRVVDMESTNLTDQPSVQNAVLRVVRDLPRRVVLNSSTGYAVPISAAASRELAIEWITKVRTVGPGGASLEGKFLHAKAAGNDASVHAALASDVAGAVLFSNLTDGTGATVPNLTNALIVEGVMNTSAEPFEPGCRQVSSNVAGTIAAVGTDVFSLLNAGFAAGNKTGSSMATPQVVALAMYLWTLAPSLTPQDVMARLRATARPGVAQSNSGFTTSVVATAPAIDAYAAVLSADEGLAAPRVRRTLLDVDNTAGAARPDGTFDEHDVQRYLNEIDARAGTDFDYSRYDLNGDGRTGGATTSRFDLDANVLPAWTSVSFAIDGTSVTYDETRLTDVRILCFYAFSELYDGDDAVRDAVLDNRCAPPVVIVTPSSVTLGPSDALQFSATVVGLPDQAVTWSAAAGTISATGLFTAGTTAGIVTVRATSVAAPTVFGEAIVTVDGRPKSNASIQIGDSGSPAGHIRAYVSATGFDLTRPLGERDAVLAAFAEELARVRLGNLGVLVYEPITFTYTYTASDLGGLQASAFNGATVDVTVGNLRPDPANPGTFGQGDLSVGGRDGTVRARAGDIDEIWVSGGRSTVTADVRSASGIGVGSLFAATESLTVDLTVGQYTTASSNGSVNLTGNALGAIRLRGAAPRRLFFFQNNNTNLQVGSVSGNVSIDRNTLPQGLDQVGVSSIGGNLAITSNRGFTDADATAWASQRSIGGSLTVSGNQP